MMWGGVGVVVVAIAIVAFMVLSPDGTSGDVEESALLSGGSLIGDPDALVTLVEFGDFQ